MLCVLLVHLRYLTPTAPITSCRPRGYVPTTPLIDNHVLNDRESCLKLLIGGEQAAFPDNSIPASAAAEVVAKLESDQRKPTCSACHYMVKGGIRWTVRRRERDGAHLAHHMKTR